MSEQEVKYGRYIALKDFAFKEPLGDADIDLSQVQFVEVEDRSKYDEEDIIPQGEIFEISDDIDAEQYDFLIAIIKSGFLMPLADYRESQIDEIMKDDTEIL